MNAAVVCMFVFLAAAYIAWQWYDAEKRIDELEDEVYECMIRLKHNRWSRTDERICGRER